MEGRRAAGHLGDQGPLVLGLRHVVVQSSGVNIFVGTRWRTGLSDLQQTQNNRTVSGNHRQQVQFVTDCTSSGTFRQYLKTYLFSLSLSADCKKAKRQRTRKERQKERLISAQFLIF